MPSCEVCGAVQSKLNQGRWCNTCFSEQNNNSHVGEVSGVTPNACTS